MKQPPFGFPLKAEGWLKYIWSIPGPVRGDGEGDMDMLGDDTGGGRWICRNWVVCCWGYHLSFFFGVPPHFEASPNVPIKGVVLNITLLDLFLTVSFLRVDVCRLDIKRPCSIPFLGASFPHVGFGIGFVHSPDNGNSSILLRSIVYFPLLVSMGIYHYWRCCFSRELKQMDAICFMINGFICGQRNFFPRDLKLAF